MAQTAEAEKATKAQEDKINAAEAEFNEAPPSQPSSSGSIDMLLDMEVPITVAIGKTETTVRRLLQLGPGAVLRLNKSIDEPVDLYLRDTRFATGNVVVVDGKFAIRISKILGLEKQNSREIK